MKRNLLLILIVFFTATMLSAEINKNDIIGKKKRFHVSIVGETSDSTLFIEFKDENKYTFFTPYGGYLWSSSDYKINGDTITFSVLNEENTLADELNKLFTLSNKNQTVDFTYDKDFCTFNFKGGYKNGNVGLFPKTCESTPDGTVCMLGNTKVIKKSGYLVPVENLNVRKEPSLKSDVGSIDYDFELMRLTNEDYLGTGMFNKDYNRAELENQNRFSKVLIAGMIRKFSAVTEQKQTIDGITAPWYRIGFTDGEEGAERFYWIFGGYIREISNPDTKEYENLFFEAAVKKGYLIPMATINENKQNAYNQAKTVFAYAEPLYELCYVIESKYDYTAEKKNYYTIYYYNNNCTYSTVVEFVNNDLLSSSKLKIGMTKQSVVELLGQPIETSADSIVYDSFEYSQGYGYRITFTITDNTVSKIKVYFEK